MILPSCFSYGPGSKQTMPIDISVVYLYTLKQKTNIVRQNNNHENEWMNEWINKIINKTHSTQAQNTVFIFKKATKLILLTLFIILRSLKFIVFLVQYFGLSAWSLWLPWVVSDFFNNSSVKHVM